MDVRELAEGEIFDCFLSPDKMTTYQRARLAYRMKGPRTVPQVYEVYFPAGTHVLHTKIGDRPVKIFKLRSEVYFFLADREEGRPIRTLVPTLYDFVLHWVEDFDLPAPFNEE
jgi:hypothetical protein